MLHAGELFVLGIASLVAAVVSFIVGSLLIWLGASLAGIRDATFAKSAATAFLASIVWWIVPGVLSIIPCIGPMIGIVLALFISLGIVVVVFNCSAKEAALAWVLYIIGHTIVMAIAHPFAH